MPDFQYIIRLLDPNVYFSLNKQMNKIYIWMFCQYFLALKQHVDLGRVPLYLLASDYSFTRVGEEDPKNWKEKGGYRLDGVRKQHIGADILFTFGRSHMPPESKTIL